MRKIFLIKGKYMRIDQRKTIELYVLCPEKEVKVTGTRTRARKVMRKYAAMLPASS